MTEASTSELHAEAERALAAADARLAELIARVGPCKLGAHTLGPFERHDYFSGLVEAIVSQQLSAKAADTIFRRVVAAVGPTFDAASLARIPEPALREAGLSGAKARYVRGLADEVLAGRLRLDRLDAMTDDEVVDELSRLKGIGRWTAEMILMFHLRRLDVLPVDDLGIQKGMMRLFGLRKLPAKARMEKLARPWRPYRSVACWYLWRLNELPAPAPKRRASRA